jgi:hypothetical protein
MAKSAVSTVVTIAVLAAAAFGVARLRPALANVVHKTKARDDVVVLPPPDQLKVAALGYDAAAVDLLWAKTLVEYGIHGQERRAFNALPVYLDSILALEPDYEPLFRYVDTLLIWRWPAGTDVDARAARKYLERGIAARPRDHHVWRRYGEFLAYLAPSFLKDEKEINEWRHDGARALAQAVELGANPDLSAATLLTKSGEEEAAIRFLSRAYALTDPRDPAREQIALKLRALKASAANQAATRTVQFVESQWKQQLGFLPRGEWLLLGPMRDPLACVGPGTNAKAACARDWDSVVPSSGDAD